MDNHSTRIRRKVVVLIIFLLSVFSVKAQTENDLVQVADEMYKFGDKLDAMDVYKQALALNNSNAYVNYMIG